jgi:hypothetical protein
LAAGARSQGNLRGTAALKRAGQQDAGVVRTRSGRPGTFQVGEVNPLQTPDVGRRQHNRRRHARSVRLRPPARAHAPAVTRAKPWEAELGTRRRQVVADPGAEPEELGGHDRADGVHPGVIGVGVAAAVPMKARDRIGAAGLQLAT